MIRLPVVMLHLLSESNKGKMLLSIYNQIIYQIINITTIIMKKSFIALAAAGLLLASCGSNCMGKGVNFADADDAKENYIMTASADEANCVEVY
ncbi:hypothetical protein KORDIASMS9_03567 [Kordia sp. SMS9]|nr:hypothetical protein KORDIASMS9_03567 [Kordia sp. SMS9]